MTTLSHDQQSQQGAHNIVTPRGIARHLLRKCHPGYPAYVGTFSRSVNFAKQGDFGGPTECWAPECYPGSSYGPADPQHQYGHIRKLMQESDSELTAKFMPEPAPM